MNIRSFVGTGIALFAFAYVVGRCSLGCAASPQEKAAAADATFGGEMVACVTKSATLEEAHVCRAEVRKRWRVDGGSR